MYLSYSPLEGDVHNAKEGQVCETEGERWMSRAASTVSHVKHS